VTFSLTYRVTAKSSPYVRTFWPNLHKLSRALKALCGPLVLSGGDGWQVPLQLFRCDIIPHVSAELSD
jgi:hypothetical protein